MMMRRWNQWACSLQGGDSETWEQWRWRIPFGEVACRGTCCVNTKHGIRNMPVGTHGGLPRRG